MNQLVPITSTILPALVAAAGLRFLEFFTANVRSPHARRANARAADEFLAWCASVGVPSMAPSNRCTSQRGSNREHPSSPRRASSTVRSDPPSV